MSINWVMLSSDSRGFTPLPGEQHLYSSPPRTSLVLKSLASYPGNEPFSADSTSGTVHLTNRRVIYLPATPNDRLQSFACPILNLHDTHVEAPWFGANIWTALVQPVPGGGIPAHLPALELKMTFKDGGAFDLHSTFERIKERLLQAVDVAQMASGGEQGVDMGNVNLDELPAYEASPTSPLVSVGAPQRREEPVEPPSERPPGYEEVQRESVAEDLERRLRASG
ncbi:hypothetical protein BT63DRAFT_30749 [Microthyrium microscopicum]|uniref:WW-domain-binding protein n=1 Tax=Microthyrium microscopicum TaxID=703497 RepID=A0A6A6US86_9PEZI|nr:hypothetical protein BT63DRAFT_30749 [Microthyrium microscopicum]